MKIKYFKKFACIATVICIIASMLSTVAFAQTSAVTVTSAAVGKNELAATVEDAFVIASGSTIAVSGTHESPEAEITYLVSPVDSNEPIEGIGQTTASDSGVFSFNVMLPVIMDAGTYRLRISGEDNTTPIVRYFKTVVGLEKRVVITSAADSIKTIGGTLEIEAEILNEVIGDEIVWKVESGSDVVSIKDGVVTALKNGIAVVTASLSTNPAVYAKKTIVVDTTAVNEVSLSVSAEGEGRITSSGAYEGDASQLTKSFAPGSEFTLVAESIDGSEFVHWADSRSGRIVSKSPEYSFALGTNLTLTALFRTYGNPAYVMFVEKNNRLLQKSNATDDVIVPNDPFYMGYDFAYWNEEGVGESAIKANDTIVANTYSNNVTFKANHTKTDIAYKVTAVNAADDISGEYSYDTKLTVTPAEPEEGKKFAYWKKDGIIVSYDENYTFFVGAYDTTVEAVYEDEDVVVGEAPVITMAEPTIVSGNRIAFFAERDLPENYTMLENGILVINAANIAEGAELTLENAHYKAISTSVANKGQFTVRKANVQAGEVWMGRAYMIYKDGDNIVTVYSNSVTKSLN